MALKNIGALWLKTREDGTEFFSGTINNGIHGDINIVVFKNEKKDSEKSPEALVGFQGRGFADGVQPDFCHSLLLEALIFQ